MNEANKQLVARFFALMSKGDSAGAFRLVSDDVVWWVPGTLPFAGTLNKEQYENVVTRIEEGFPGGVEFNVTGMTAEADRVAAEVESTGTHVNGREYNNKYHFLFVVEDGVITSVKEYMDTGHLRDLLA